MIHAKVMTADRAWATVGTANADIRSMALNFEVNCIIHTPSVVADLDDQFERDLTGCREITLEELMNKGRLVSIAENVCRLLSPVL
jgi:cardiolipin synthase